jgi:shikimate kinase
MRRPFPLIETIIFLSAPTATIMERLEPRSSDGYGSTDWKRQKVGKLIETIEPLLRQSADHEIDSSGPTSSTVDEILRVV